jgi:DNA-binding NarL/FixJ family response regulator
MLQKKDKEIIELKHFLQKYMDIESVFLKEIQSFEPKSEVDYPSFIEKLKTQIIEMNNFGKNFTDKLKNSNQETEKYLFSQVLKKKHPFLTDQEIGLCTYFKMNTPSKEIAVLEGITDGTVRVYKNKIKNKIGLSQMDSLNEYLLNIPLRKTA